MRHDRKLSRWWCAGRGLSPMEWLIFASLFALLLTLSGCGTTPSISGSPKLSAPEAVIAPIPPPVYLPAGEAVPEDLLDNLAINADIANELRSRLRAIQAWARSIGAMR